MLVVLDTIILLLFLIYIRYEKELIKQSKEELINSIYESKEELKTLFINGEESKSSIEDMLRIYENERDREFNEKIENLKLELYGTTADVLHPDLKNIPHEDYDAEIIKTQMVAEEYAE